jgi:hypothetical protein
MNQRHSLAVGQRHLRIPLPCFVIDLPQVIPYKEGLVQVGRGADSFDRVPLLDEGFGLDDVELRILLLEVENAERQSVRAGYRIFNDYPEGDE